MTPDLVAADGNNLPVPGALALVEKLVVEDVIAVHLSPLRPLRHNTTRQSEMADPRSL